MTRKLLAIVALAMIAAACGPGPLPAILVREDPRRDRFPSKSDEPLDLHIAIRRDKLDDVRRLLDDGADPNVRWGDRGDHNPLQEALDTNSGIPRSHRDEIVRLLLAHGADPNLRWCPFESRGNDSGGITCRSAEGATPLMAAAGSDMSEIVELLLAAGADPGLKDWSGASALDHASGEITFELIARKLFPRMSTRPPDQNGVLSRWSHQRRATGHVRLLVNIGADPNERVTPDWVDWTPLALAMQQTWSWTARVLLDAGADPNARWCFSLGWYSTRKEARTKDPACNHGNGTTALMQAASQGRADLVRALLEHGADPSLTDWNGKSAGDLAKTDEIRTLLSRKSS